MGVSKETIASFTSKVWYGTGAIGLDLSYGMFNGRLSKYLTNVLKLNTNFLLGLTSAARIWDGINDPMMGAIVDNSGGKHGKYRPWVIRGSLCNALVLVLLFLNPGFKLGSAALYTYIAVMYVGWGMTNTMADIPYWSMVPSFTSDPKERSILATIARTFSGLGQGIVQIGSPLILDALAKSADTAGKPIWDQRGYSVTAIICGVCLIGFSMLSMSKVRERHVIKTNEKFSFGKIFKVVRGNDQLRIFMLFAMLSNAGFYSTSGVLDYYFDIVAESSAAQSLFSAIGAAGSIIGLAVVPLGLKLTSRRKIYQFSLLLMIAGYLGMCAAGFLMLPVIVLDLFFLVASVGSAAMFVSQTVFLADIVDYGEVKMGFRSESVTFSMKGFLQKMAYTVQTVILFTSLGIVKYNDLPTNGAGIVDIKAVTDVLWLNRIKNAIRIVFFIVPPVFILLSLIVFSSKFKLHGEYMDDITAKVTAAKQASLDATAIDNPGIINSDDC